MISNVQLKWLSYKWWWFNTLCAWSPWLSQQRNNKWDLISHCPNRWTTWRNHLPHAKKPVRIYIPQVITLLSHTNQLSIESPLYYQMDSYQSLKAIYVSIVVLVLSLNIMVGESQLSPTFYASTCPTALATIRTTIRTAVSRERRMAARLIRLHFHDCFVEVRFICSFSLYNVWP